MRNLMSILVIAAVVAIMFALGYQLAPDDSEQIVAVSSADKKALAGPAGTTDHSAHHAHAEIQAGLKLSRSEKFDFDPPAPGTYQLPVIRAAADGEVLDTLGKERLLHEVYDGKVILLSFIYTRCTDANGCPLATAVLYKIFGASKADEALANNLRMISLSFDPINDTPEVMSQYRGSDAAHWQGGAEWIDLTTGSEGQLAPILRDYDQVVRRRVNDEGNPTDQFGHQLRAYLIDRNKQIRNIYGLGFLDPRLLIADVKTLLAEEHVASH